MSPCLQCCQLSRFSLVVWRQILIIMGRIIKIWRQIPSSPLLKPWSKVTIGEDMLGGETTRHVHGLKLPSLTQRTGLVCLDVKP